MGVSGDTLTSHHSSNYGRDQSGCLLSPQKILGHACRLGAIIRADPFSPSEVLHSRSYRHPQFIMSFKNLKMTNSHIKHGIYYPFCCLKNPTSFSVYGYLSFSLTPDILESDWLTSSWSMQTVNKFQECSVSEYSFTGQRVWIHIECN